LRVLAWASKIIQKNEEVEMTRKIALGVMGALLVLAAVFAFVLRDLTKKISLEQAEAVIATATAEATARLGELASEAEEHGYQLVPVATAMTETPGPPTSTPESAEATATLTTCQPPQESPVITMPGVQLVWYQSACMFKAEPIPTITSQLTETYPCRVIHESVITTEMDHVSTSGDFLHVEYWYPGEPERETILPADKAAGGRFNFTRPLQGWVWEYDGCTLEEVEAQVEAHITRQLEGGANNEGYFPFEEVEDAKAWHPSLLFLPAGK
jgi:hypothetical protein